MVDPTFYTNIIMQQEWRVMGGLQDKIIRTLDDIGRVSDYLYQQKLNKGYESLNNTLENIMELTDTLFTMSKEGKIDFDTQRLIENLTAAVNAMEDKDGVLLADILVFDIAGQLQEIVQ